MNGSVIKDQKQVAEVLVEHCATLADGIGGDVAESRHWRILKIIPVSSRFNRKPIMGNRPSMLILSRKDKFSLYLNR